MNKSPGISLAVTLLLLAACTNVITPSQPTVDAPLAGTSFTTPVSTIQPATMVPLSTPVTTATPTITPTPIVHVVQSGDTLLGIALDYGVDVDALQTLNGIANPQSLQVGQELIIPTGEENIADVPGLLLPTPTPLSFGVRGVAFYETPVGSLWCLGEIVNTTEFTLTNVQVRVMLFDAAGERLTEADAFAAADIIPPGERAPFGILFTNPPPDWTSPQVAIVRGEAAGALADSYVPIAVIEAEGQPAGSQIQMRGVVQNTSAEQTASGVSVIVTTYDAEGLVTGFRQGTAEVEGTLAPGATAPFSLLFTFHGDVPTDYNVIALGRIPAE